MNSVILGVVVVVLASIFGVSVGGEVRRDDKVYQNSIELKYVFDELF